VLYLLRLVCRSEGENHARALLLQMTQTLPITLQSLHSEDLNSTGKVEVRAKLPQSRPAGRHAGKRGRSHEPRAGDQRRELAGGYERRAVTRDLQDARKEVRTC
jgi:hypothetical protein